MMYVCSCNEGKRVGERVLCPWSRKLQVNFTKGLSSTHTKKNGVSCANPFLRYGEFRPPNSGD
jgi:hypothetical protein